MVNAIIAIALYFLGGFMVGYVIALISPEEEPGEGVSMVTIMIRALIFAMGVASIGIALRIV